LAECIRTISEKDAEKMKLLRELGRSYIKYLQSQAATTYEFGQASGTLGVSDSGPSSDLEICKANIEIIERLLAL